MRGGAANERARAVTVSKDALADKTGDGPPRRRTRYREHFQEFALAGQNFVSENRPEAISRFKAAPTASKKGARSVCSPADLTFVAPRSAQIARQEVYTSPIIEYKRVTSGLGVSARALGRRGRPRGRHGM